MTKPSKKMTVTAIMQTPGQTITAFFNELPGLVVQGDSEDAVKRKLISVLQSYVKRLEGMDSELDIQTRSFA